MNIALDTNAYKQYLLGKEDIMEEALKAKVVYLSVIVVGELFAGFHGGSKMKGNVDALEGFLSKSFVEILQVNRNTAHIFGEIKYALSKKGTPIPTNDIWIAAHAVETGSRLITYDKHFLKIPGLRVWDVLQT